jgi:hypothetical protein
MTLRPFVQARTGRLVAAMAALALLATGSTGAGRAAAQPLAAAPASAPGQRTDEPPPGTSCDVFPADNVWNTDISSLPVDPHSKTWLKTMHAGSTNLHPDFGAPPYGMPYGVVDDSHPKVSIRFRYEHESDPGPYPFGKDIPLEQGSDRHALVIDKDTCALYELFAARWHHGDPTAGSGAIFDLDSNALRHDGWTSADAAGCQSSRAWSDGTRCGPASSTTPSGSRPSSRTAITPGRPARRRDLQRRVPADGGPLPDEGVVRHLPLQRRRSRDHAGD